MKLIGICGYMGAGKSTAAEILAARFGFVRVRFADPLKTMLRALGLTDAELDGPLKETPSPWLAGATPRWAMQSLGEEWGRRLIDRDLWVGHWAARAEATLAAGKTVVTDDVRYAGEVAAIRARGGQVLRIERPGLARGAHASEALDPALCDFTVTNSGSRAEFEASIERALARLG